MGGRSLVMVIPARISKSEEVDEGGERGHTDRLASSDQSSHRVLRIDERERTLIVENDGEPLSNLLRIRELLDVSEIPDSISRNDLLARTVDDSRRGEFSSVDFEHLRSYVDSPLLQGGGVVGRLDLGESSLEHRDSLSWSDGSEEKRLGGLIGVEFLDVLLSSFDRYELDGPESDLADLDAGPFGVLESDVVVSLEIRLATTTKSSQRPSRHDDEKDEDVQRRWCSFHRSQTRIERRKASRAT